jgi:hypothetical protein
MASTRLGLDLLRSIGRLMECVVVCSFIVGDSKPPPCRRHPKSPPWRITRPRVVDHEASTTTMVRTWLEWRLHSVRLQPVKMQDWPIFLEFNGSGPIPAVLLPHRPPWLRLACVPPPSTRIGRGGAPHWECGKWENIMACC